MGVENKIEKLFLGHDQVSLQTDILPVVLEEFEQQSFTPEICTMACEFVKQSLYALFVQGVHVVCSPIFNGNPNCCELSVIDMVWDVICR